MLVWNLLFFILSCIVLVKSSSVLLGSLSKVAYYLKLNEFAVGFIIMAISTSLPELFVGITAGLDKSSSLALGNVIGSNILDLTLVIGVVAILVRDLKITSKIIKKDIVYMIGFVILPLLLMWDQKLSRLDGVLLLAVFGLYIWQMIRQEHSFSKTVDTVRRRDAMWNFFLTFVCIFLLIVSAEFVVEFATRLSGDLALPNILIGLLVISLGTSLPELIFETKAVLNKHEEMAVGDLLGSVITNSTLVLGITAVIHPIEADFLIFFTSAIFMVLISFIFMTFAESDKGLSWKEGLSLIMLYLFFIMVESHITMLGG
jgi:cation:H+ antiporter